MDLVRDVLDKQLLDREEEQMGRVDGLVMQLGEDTQPRVTHILIGGPVLGARVHPLFARAAKVLARMWGPKRSEPVRIPWSRVLTVGRDIKLDVKGAETGALDWEIWVAEHIIEHIPGGGSEEDSDGA